MSEISPSYSTGTSYKGMSIAALLCVAIGFFSAPSIRSQAGVQTKKPDDLNIGVPTMVTEPRGPETVLPAESIGHDDLLDISVPYCPELTRQFRVSSDGTLVLPLLHKPIAVAGLLPHQVSGRIVEQLERDGVMKEPIVIVSVAEYRSRPVSVVGAVVHPLTFQATGTTTLLDAIARAGGLSATAGGTLFITSTITDSTGQVHQTVRTVSSSALLQGSDPAANIHLNGGEEIRIPEAGRIFVAGNVHHPGMFFMQNNAEMTVLKAIALSEGLASFTANDAYIYRESADSKVRAEVKVPLHRIITRQDADMHMQADDILYIPENSGKKMTSRVFAQITGFAQSTASGILIYH